MQKYTLLVTYFDIIRSFIRHNYGGCIKHRAKKGYVYVLVSTWSWERILSTSWIIQGSQAHSTQSISSCILWLNPGLYAGTPYGLDHNCCFSEPIFYLSYLYLDVVSNFSIFHKYYKSLDSCNTIFLLSFVIKSTVLRNPVFGFVPTQYMTQMISGVSMGPTHQRKG